MDAIGGCKLQNRIPLGAVPIPLFRHVCCRMYRLATMHNVTDRGQ